MSTPNGLLIPPKLYQSVCMVHFHFTYSNVLYIKGLLHSAVNRRFKIKLGHQFCLALPCLTSLDVSETWHTMLHYYHCLQYLRMYTYDIQRHSHWE